MKSRSKTPIDPTNKTYVSSSNKTRTIGKKLSTKYGSKSPQAECNAAKDSTDSPDCRRGFKQLKDTCWFTSTLNSLVLGKISSRHIKNIIPSKKEEVELPNNQCPIKVSRDFILEYAHRFYNPSPENIQHAENLIQHVVKNNSIKDGGIFPIKVLKTLFDECFRDQYIMIRTEQHIDTPKDIPDDCKFCVFYNRSESVMNTTNISPKLRGTDFVLDSCSIYMRFTRGDPHVICGFNCKNKDYVYDSNMNDPLQIDWSKTATSLTNKIRCYSSKFYEGRSSSRSRLSSADFMYIIYTKTI